MKIKPHQVYKNKFITDIGFSVGVGVLINFLAYLLNVILGNNLSQADFGTFNAILSLIYIVTLPTVTFQALITKKVGENREKDLKNFINSNFKRFSILGIIVAGGMLALSIPIAQFAKIESIYILPIALIALVNIIFALPKGILFGLQKIKLVHVILLIEMGIRSAVSIYAAYQTKDVLIPTLAFLIATTISTFVALPYLKSKKDEEETPKESLTGSITLSDSAYTMATYLLLNSGYTLDILLVNPAFRGAYSAVVLLGKIVFFAAVNINNVMFSTVTSQKDIKKKLKVLALAMFLNILITSGITIVYALMHDQIVAIVFGGKYAEISDHIAKMALGMIFYSSTFMLVNFMIASGKRLQLLALSFTVIVQIYLFNINNSSLSDAVNNQLIVYIIFFFSNLAVMTYLYVKRRLNKIEPLTEEFLDPPTLP